MQSSFKLSKWINCMYATVLRYVNHFVHRIFAQVQFWTRIAHFSQELEVTKEKRIQLKEWKDLTNNLKPLQLVRVFFSFLHRLHVSLLSEHLHFVFIFHGCTLAVAFEWLAGTITNYWYNAQQKIKRNEQNSNVTTAITK